MARLRFSCAGFVLGLCLSYQGGVTANDALVVASFAVLGLSCVLLVIAKK
ncbi:MAG: hypothetical protein LBL73_10415 [Synergistaceae bacterium]|jgi:hypothetical protein|nr:hypothetical protein [Synergistaceae bacterium]